METRSMIEEKLLPDARLTIEEKLLKEKNSVIEEKTMVERSSTIEVINVKKRFEDVDAISGITMTIPDGCVFGLLGTNGAGKSTLIRMIAGVLKPDEGEILIHGENVWDNPKTKAECFYISDDQYFFPNATIESMANFYKNYYPSFDSEKFKLYIEHFQLPAKRKVQTLSKGMKKQLSIILGICCNTRYLLCDETFDGLDPVVRQAVKSIFANEMETRKLTPIIASHNLRELEDICDHVGLLHQGGILLSKDLIDMKCNLHRIQLVLPEENDSEELQLIEEENNSEQLQLIEEENDSEEYKEIIEKTKNRNQMLNEIFDIVQYSSSGRLITLTVRGTEAEIFEKIQSLNPIYHELLPLSLEEIFISETEVVGYDVKKLIF